MSYTVLARRYRSATFDEVIGQDHVAQTLKKAIRSGRVAHAYLFCGTRGTGKTSMARILAKALNCRQSEGPTADPCGECDSCLAIARGEDMDVIEIDAASNTGVDNIREVIENSQYRPARSRFKVYIIDEVHMLSKSAFNALLKTLEEPPEHVKFILATTEPEKVLPTILSRCQRYDFRNITSREIAAHLKTICQKEKIKAEEEALLLVAKAGAGSMRDALSLLDRLLSVGEKNLSGEFVEQLLGLPKAQILFDLAGAIGAGDVKSTLAQADSILQSGLSADALIGALVDHLRNLLILRTCGPESNLVDVPGLATEQLVEQANRFDPAALTQNITILEELRRNMRQSLTGRALLDATLARLAMADQFKSIGDLLSRLDGGGAAPARASQPTFAQTAQKKNPEPARQAAAVNVLENATRPAAPPQDCGPESNIEPVDPSNLPAVWQTLLSLLSTHGPVLQSLLSPGKLVAIEDGRAVVRYAAQHETFVKMLERNGKKELVREKLSELLGQNVGVRFDLDRDEDVAPAAAQPAQASRAGESKPSARATTPDETAASTASAKLTPELIESLRSEPLIKALMDHMGAQIVKVEQ